MTHIGLLATVSAALTIALAAAWVSIAFASGAFGAVNPYLILVPSPPIDIFACAVPRDWWPEIAGAALALAVAPMLFGRR